MADHIRVTREAAEWKTVYLSGSAKESQSEMVLRYTYYIERGAWEKVTYRPHRRTKVPLWAAESLRHAFNVIVPLNRIKTERKAKVSNG